MNQPRHCSLCGGAGHLAKDCPWLRVQFAPVPGLTSGLPGVRGMLLVSYTEPHAFNDER